MPGFTAELSTFTLDKGGFTKTLDLAVKRQMRQAARAFVREAASSVPFRTGFARGTFQNILQATGQSASERSTGARVFAASRASNSLIKRATFGKREYYQKRILKTPQSGRQLATPPNAIFRESGYVYTFNFEVFIDYFNINDFVANPRTPSSPWQAFERGRQAFNNYLNTTGRLRLPKVTSFVIVHRLTVTNTSITRRLVGPLDR